MRPIRVIAVAGALVNRLGLQTAAPTSAERATAERASATWQVKITNLTPPGAGAPGSQPLSPPVFAVHRPEFHVWQVGELASHALAAVAEDANNPVLVSALSKQPGVVEAVASTDGPIPSGGSAEFTLRVPPGHQVSIVSMLVNTNDAFTGIDGLQLRGRQVAVRTNAYDAGSEANNERIAFIPGPCCGNFFVREPEGDVIRPHEGITGRGDLDPAVYGWTDPVAEIEFTRVD
jgi:hypothetical protein